MNSFSMKIKVPLLRLEYSNKTTKTVSEVRKADGSFKTDTKQIIKEHVNLYSKLDMYKEGLSNTKIKLLQIRCFEMMSVIIEIKI